MLSTCLWLGLRVAFYPGLFRRAILQSGNALSPWALRNDHRHTASVVGRVFNCSAAENTSTNNSSLSSPVDLNSTALVDCLRKIPFQQLVVIPSAFVVRSRWVTRGRWREVKMGHAGEVQGDRLAEKRGREGRERGGRERWIERVIEMNRVSALLIEREGWMMERRKEGGEREEETDGERRERERVLCNMNPQFTVLANVVFIPYSL